MPRIRCSPPPAAATELAFGRLVEPHRRELQAHCYRMLGSLHDSEDALQDALLRAWRALPRFEGRSALRPWLYKIATNTCLDAIAKRPKRILPLDHGPPTDAAPGEPLAESVWIEPYPDDKLGLEDGYAAPEARYEQREGVELAFVAAQANGQPVVGAYTWQPDEQCYRPFALDVLMLHGAEIHEITSFITRSGEGLGPDEIAHFPSQPTDPSTVGAMFEHFGLPGRLD